MVLTMKYDGSVGSYEDLEYILGDRITFKMGIVYIEIDGGYERLDVGDEVTFYLVASGKRKSEEVSQDRG